MKTSKSILMSVTTLTIKRVKTIQMPNLPNCWLMLLLVMLIGSSNLSAAHFATFTGTDGCTYNLVDHNTYGGTVHWIQVADSDRPNLPSPYTNWQSAPSSDAAGHCNGSGGGGSTGTFTGTDGCTYNLVDHNTYGGTVHWIQVADSDRPNLPSPYTNWQSAPSSDAAGHCNGSGGGGSTDTFTGTDGCTYNLVDHNTYGGTVHWIQVADSDRPNLPSPYTNWQSAPSSDAAGHCNGSGGGGSTDTFTGTDGCTYNLVDHNTYGGTVHWIQVAVGDRPNLPSPYTGWQSAPSSDAQGSTCGGGGGGNNDLPTFGYGVDAKPTYFSLDASKTYQQNKANGQIFLFQNIQVKNATTKTTLEYLKDVHARYYRILIYRPSNAGNNLNWIRDLYAPLVEDVINQGFIPYILVNNESVAQSFPAPTLNGTQVSWPDQSSFINNFAIVFEEVVKQLHPKGAQLFEMFNEPDNWVHGGFESPKFRPTQAADLWNRCYTKVRQHSNLDNAILVTSGLVGHTHGGPTNAYDGAASYFAATVRKGESNHGWGPNNYGFDGVGYHMYVRPTGGGANDAAYFENEVKNSINALKQYGINEMGANEWNKYKIWVSEIGWDEGQVSQATQKQALIGAMRAMKNYAGNQVAMVNWYNLSDTTTGPFGLMRGSPDSLPRDINDTKIRAMYWEAVTNGHTWYID